jgi:membrane-bound lytic murein transglycosylase F
LRSRFASLLLALLLGAAASVQAAASYDLPDAEKAGALRVLVVDGSPAFFSLNPSGEPGLDREILDGFARLRKLKLQAVTVPSWDALVPSLLEGKGDVIAGGVTVTPARARQIDFTAEVFPTRNVVVTRKPTKLVTTLVELRALRVGTIKGSSMAEAIAAAGVPASNLDDALVSGGAPDALRKGRITATVSGIEDAFLYKRADPEMQIGMFVGPAGSLAFGVRKDAPKLKAALDDYVNNLRRTPTWSRLVLKYFGEQAPELLKKARAE